MNTTGINMRVLAILTLSLLAIQIQSTQARAAASELELGADVTAELAGSITQAVDLQENQTTTEKPETELSNGILSKVKTVIGLLLQRTLSIAKGAAAGILEFLRTLPLRVLRKALDCVTAKVNELRFILTSAVQDALNIFNMVTQLQTRLSNCGTDVAAASCKSNIVMEAAVRVLSLPKTIALHVTMITSWAANLQPSMVQCAVTKLAELAVDGPTVVRAVGTCVQQQIDAI